MCVCVCVRARVRVCAQGAGLVESVTKLSKVIGAIVKDLLFPLCLDKIQIQ